MSTSATSMDESAGPDRPSRGSGPVLLYDGLCGFCDATVQFVLSRDPRGSLRFAPLQGAFAARVLSRHPELRTVDSLILVEYGTHDGIERVRVRSDGALAVARYLGGPWRLAGVLRIVPRPFRDAVYDGFARIRYRLFGRRDACALPSPGVRSRFLD